MGGGGGGGGSAAPAEKGPALANVKYSPPPQGERYKASYQPMQAQQPTQQFQIPSLEQLGQFQQPNGLAGLQAAFAQMMAGNIGMQQPMQRGLVNPNYQSQALNYRPNMTGAMQSLNRVVPSVAEQQRLQAIEDARIAAEAAANAPPPNYDGGGG